MTDIPSVLIWVQTVCKGYQQMTKKLLLARKKLKEPISIIQVQHRKQFWLSKKLCSVTCISLSDHAYKSYLPLTSFILYRYSNKIILCHCSGEPGHEKTSAQWRYRLACTTAVTQQIWLDSVQWSRRRWHNDRQMDKQINKSKKKIKKFLLLFRDHYYLWETMTHIRMILNTCA